MMHRRYKTWTDDAASLDGKGNLLLKVYEKDGDYYTSQLQTGSNYMDRPPDGQYTRQSSRVGNAHHFIFAATANRVP
jgi:hypothetical protein